MTSPSLAITRLQRLRAAAAYENPVAVKEMRSRMRGGRGFAVIGTYVGVLGVGFCMTMATIGAARYYAPSRDLSDIGRGTFATLGILQMALVCLLSPALTSGSVTVEREQLTLDLLRLTRLSSRTILVGKLASSLSYLLLLVLSSLPLASICFLFGGVSPTEMALAYGLTLSAGVLMGSVGTWWSVFCKRTSASNAASYATALLFLVVIPVYFAFLEAYMRNGAMNAEGPWLAFFMVTLTLSGTLPAMVGGVLTAMILREYRPAWRPRLVGLIAFGFYSVVLLLPLASLFLDNFGYDPAFASGIMVLHPVFAMQRLVLDDPGMYPGTGFITPLVQAAVCLLLYLALSFALMVFSTARFEATRTG
jgi:ABC-type transport system involved in multi-copper enzyme maturation permease subunit